MMIMDVENMDRILLNRLSSLPYLLLFFSSIVYLDFGTSKHMSLTFLTDGHQSKSQRRWNVRTSYIECNSPLAGLSFFLCDVQCNVKFQCNGVLRFQSWQFAIIPLCSTDWMLAISHWNCGASQDPGLSTVSTFGKLAIFCLHPSWG